MKKLLPLVALLPLTPIAAATISYELTGPGSMVAAVQSDLGEYRSNGGPGCGWGAGDHYGAFVTMIGDDGTGYEFLTRSELVPGITDTSGPGIHQFLNNRRLTYTMAPRGAIRSVRQVTLNACRGQVLYQLVYTGKPIACGDGSCGQAPLNCTVHANGTLDLGLVNSGERTRANTPVTVRCSRNVTGRVRATGVGGTDKLGYSGSGVSGEVFVDGHPGSQGVIVVAGESGTVSELVADAQATDSAAGGPRDASIVVEFTAE